MSRPRTVAVVQARLGSTRLPGKTLLDLGGKPAVLRVLERAAAIPGVDAVVAAVPRGRRDAPLRQALERSGLAMVYAGSEKDVLDRVYRAAAKAKADVVLRLTGDCPLLDPKVSGEVVEALRRERADYASNIHPPTFPDGLDTEVMRFSALRRAWRLARTPLEREHVTVFLRDHPELFRQVCVTRAPNLNSLRWTLDNPADLRFLRAVFAALGRGSRLFGMEEILALLRRRPKLRRINRGIASNEGYCKSIMDARESLAPPRRDIRSWPKKGASTHTAALAKRLREGLGTMIGLAGCSGRVELVSTGGAAVLRFKDPSGGDGAAAAGRFERECLARGLAVPGQAGRARLPACLHEAQADWTLAVCAAALLRLKARPEGRRGRP